MGCSKLKMGLRLPHYWKLEFNSLETTSDPHKIICLSLTSNDSVIEVYTNGHLWHWKVPNAIHHYMIIFNTPFSHNRSYCQYTTMFSVSIIPVPHQAMWYSMKITMFQTQTIIIKLVFSGFMLWFVCSYICWISFFKY